MQKIKDILTPGDHRRTTTGTTTGTYNAGTAYNTDPAYGAGTGVGTGVAGTHGTAAHDPNHPSMMQKMKDAVTPGGHHNDVPMYANTTGTGYNTSNTYEAGTRPSGLGTADYGVGEGVPMGNAATNTNTMGTAYNIAHGTGTTTQAGHPTMMEKVKDAVIPGRRAHRHKTRYNADGTLMRRNSNSSSSSSSDDEGVAGGNVCNVRKFTEIEDRPVLKERVEQYVEHVPVEKQFVVETRPVGEKVMTSGITIESKGVHENILDRVQGQTCPAPGIIEQAMGVQGTPASTVTYDKCAGSRC